MSHANGPGARAVVWVQGCSLGCPGCFNLETHSFEDGELVSVDDLFDRVVALGDSIEGITISGGEPLQQRHALSAFLKLVRSETNLSTLMFTGYTWAEIERMGERENERMGAENIDSPALPFSYAPILPELLSSVDVLIAGRYDQTQHLARDLRGSANKTVHLLSGRYTMKDIRSVPLAEVIITAEGEVVISGIDPVGW
jgi:anaerobic ribonucleoside-triphosphate reductase activating protein